MFLPMMRVWSIFARRRPKARYSNSWRRWATFNGDERAPRIATFNVNSDPVTGPGARGLSISRHGSRPEGTSGANISGSRASPEELDMRKVAGHPKVHLGSLGRPGCKPAAAFHHFAERGVSEVGIDTSRGSFWALFFTAVPPCAGREIKIVWRMTGSGTFTFRALDAHGMLIDPLGTPQPHDASTWSHPGSEIGTGFSFPHSGCWRIHVERSDVAGDLWLHVAPNDLSTTPSPQKG